MPTFEEIKRVLSNVTIGIAGAGGLGSNVAMTLTRAGIGKLIIADFDVVSESNLNRQFYFRSQIGQKKVEALKANLLNINPDVKVISFDVRLNEDNISEIFSTVDVMVEAVDNAEMKKLITEVFQEKYPNMPLILGNGMAGWGQSNDMQVTQYGSLYVCGDGKSEVSETLPPIAPRVGICACMQANVVLSIVLDPLFKQKHLP
ncbi:MAG: sulfur carrier protein ThiS adenylyltransferase ThiF [Bacteroidales bacterium]|nr:sulfur carrier protein ThiS adenylyltransferase ThiF [Bacteroidales bacterium]